MMNGNNNMDNKLRQLENQSLPDLSRRDEHWQEMKKMLQPGVMPQLSKPGNIGKLWQWVIAACFIGIISFLGFQHRNQRSTPAKQIIATKKDTIGKGNTIVVIKDNLSETVVTPGKSTEKFIAKKSRAIFSSERIPLKSTESTEPVIMSFPPDSISSTQQTDQKAMLAAFFDPLKKVSQDYIIDSKRDTVIWGKDGTALLIPANTFSANEKVTITLTEYYSYEDIITNKLSTSSDGEQLVTGGMIHLEATVNNKKVNMLPQKSIRWFVPDTSAEIADMQVFTGPEENNTNSPEEGVHHGAITAVTNSSINWRPSSTSFSHNYITTKVKVLDLRDYPFKTTSGKKYKGFFFQHSGSDLSKNELREMLHTKYPYYDKIIITGKRKKKEWDPTRFISYDQNRSETFYSIGDTTWVFPFEAKAYKLEVFDTLTYTNRSSTIQSPPDLNKQLKRVTAKYSVDINSLGWINCDKFYKTNRSKIEYVVNIGDASSNYYTFLVFDRFKSMLSGLTAGNKVVFQGVPEGETAKVISIGIKDGKPVSAMETVKLSRATLTHLKFEETTPTAFKEQAATMDK